ncbi:hypothetical protein [Bifidobacterium moukalabense]|uniref:hypothetical protein n=1 Tax=Bifidobacterium moukalabense TaxID=1333651 RepID=UPI0010F7823D|nr:hypothetical protein [Bifidobacterium moukalabense]
MVRKDEMPPTSSITKLVAETVRILAEEEGLSQRQVGQLVDRSQAYAHDRLVGNKAWDTDELDRLARHFHLTNAFALIDRARGMEGKRVD